LSFKKGEVYFKFAVNRFDLLSDRKQLEKLTTVISIDNYKDGTIYAYANRREFEKFLACGYPYEVLPHPGDAIASPAMMDVAQSAVWAKGRDRGPLAWDAYPTFPAYVALMTQFETNYPTNAKFTRSGPPASAGKSCTQKSRAT